MVGLINFNIFFVIYSLRKFSIIWEWRVYFGVRIFGLNISIIVYCLGNYGIRYDLLSFSLCNYKIEVKIFYRVDVRVRW